MRRLIAAAAGLVAGGLLWRRWPRRASVRRTLDRGRGGVAALASTTPLARLRRGSLITAKQALEEYLRHEGVPYQLQHHPLAYTAQAVAAAEHVSGNAVAKVVMVLADGTPVMLVLPASQRVDLEVLPSVVGASAVQLAEERDFAHLFPGSAVGAMPPFGNRYGVPVFVDQSLARQDTIICPAGTHTDTLSLSYADYARLVQPTQAIFSAAEGAERP